MKKVSRKGAKATQSRKRNSDLASLRKLCAFA
jgi:hypothetical protein